MYATSGVSESFSINKLPTAQKATSGNPAPPVKLSAAPTVVSTRSAPWIGEDPSDSHELHQTKKHLTIPGTQGVGRLVADAVNKVVGRLQFSMQLPYREPQ